MQRKEQAVLELPTGDKSQYMTGIIILAGITLLTLLLFKPFFLPLFWAAVLAGIFSPCHTRLENKLKSSGLSAILVVTIILISIIIPVAFVGYLLVTECSRFYTLLEGEMRPAKLYQFLAQIQEHPYVRSLISLDEEFWTGKFSEMGQEIAQFIITAFKNMTNNTLLLIIQFVMMLYALFFFIKDGAKFLQTAADYLPLDSNRVWILFNTFGSISKAALKTIFIIGGIQGLLGGLLFYFLNIEGAMTWGIMMMLTSVIPGVGSSIVWLPISVVMMLMGYYWSGGIILAFGILVVVVSIDNLLRPLLLGQDTQMHPLLVFLSTLGGIVLFGISGIVMGPMIIALFLTVWRFRLLERETAQASL